VLAILSNRYKKNTYFLFRLFKRLRTKKNRWVPTSFWWPCHRSKPPQRLVFSSSHWQLGPATPHTDPRSHSKPPDWLEWRESDHQVQHVLLHCGWQVAHTSSTVCRSLLVHILPPKNIAPCSFKKQYRLHKPSHPNVLWSKKSPRRPRWWSLVLIKKSQGNPEIGDQVLHELCQPEEGGDEGGGARHTGSSFPRASCCTRLMSFMRTAAVSMPTSLPFSATPATSRHAQGCGPRQRSAVAALHGLLRGHAARPHPHRRHCRPPPYSTWLPPAWCGTTTVRARLLHGTAPRRRGTIAVGSDLGGLDLGLSVFLLLIHLLVLVSVSVVSIMIFYIGW
jgi:hypothetical protein